MRNSYLTSPLYLCIGHAYNIIMVCVMLLAVLAAFIAWTSVERIDSIPEGNQEPILYHETEDIMLLAGTSVLIPGKRIYGAMIMSGHHLPSKNYHAQRLISTRISNARSFVQKLPFPVTEWSAVFTPPCPAFPKRKLQAERGVAWAHYRIWLEFAHFDPFLLDDHNRNVSNTISSDGNYEIYGNGTMMKHGQLYSDNDVMIIFEDDAKIAVKNIKKSLVKELSKMDADIVLLGFCKCKYERKPAPMCGHAYAITRYGARQLLRYIEPCGKAWDEQLAVLSHLNLIRYRTARSSSYKRSYLPGYPVITGKPTDTFGLFVQGKKSMGSMNT